MSSIALGMICAPKDSEAKILERCLKSVYRHVDGIFITITGENKRCEEVAKKYGAKVSHCEWKDDFAAARNFNLKQIPSSYEYYCWFDCDDVVVGAENFKKIIQKIKEEKVSAVVADYLYAFDKYGCCIARHPKTRIVRNDGTFSWSMETGELHEDLQTKANVAIAYLDSKEQEYYFEVHHKKSDHEFDKAKERNLRISKRQIEQHPNDPRAYWNYANSLVSCGKDADALSAFDTFLKMSASDDERYLAFIRRAAIFSDSGKQEFALEEAYRAMVIQPWMPDAYIILGKIFYKQNKWKHAKEMLIAGMSKEIPKVALVYNPRDYDLNPMTLLTNCYFNMGKPKEALIVVEKLLQMFPTRDDLRPIQKVLKQSVSEVAEAEAFCKKADTLTDAEFSVEYETLPDAMKSHPQVCAMRNSRFARTKKPEKEIVYYCGFTNERWDSSSEKKGIGGSEEAVINLSKRWVKLGYDVHVYNNCGNKSFVDSYGIKWHPYWEFNPRSVYSVLILWRSPGLASYPITASKLLLDVHDVLPTEEFTSERLNNLGLVLFKSKYHADLYGLRDEKFSIIPNGIDLEQFSAKGLVRRRASLIYTSSPDRGLEHLLDSWKEIKESVPQVTLDIYYGWNVFDSIFANDPVKQAWKKQMVEKMKQPGITVHGRVGHKEIARAMMQSEVFAYPCHFEEIFCISAVKAQAAGCKMVTTDYAALGEVVKKGKKSKNGDWKQFTKNLIESLKEKETEVVDVSEYSWDRVAQSWLDLCK